MTAPQYVWGPTYAEMQDPSRLAPALQERARRARQDPLDRDNLFNMHWWDDHGRIRCTRIPQALSGVDAEIVVLTANHFPTGSHKVGPNYAILVEKQLDGEVVPGRHRIVCPSTGNFGIGGAWVAPRMGYDALVVLPEDMSRERFERIRAYGAEVIATPGSESNVKEIYDKVRELLRDPDNRVVQQFADFGNYRFHYAVTGHAALQAAGGRVAAFVSAMGSAGTLAAGDRLKQENPDMRIVGLEPEQCPTLYNVGYGSHRIEGIGDKHVTWIHNVFNMDLLMCIDDQECLEGLQLLQEGRDVLQRELDLDPELLDSWDGRFGISSVCNILGAIRACRHYGFGRGDVVVTVATDGFDRYPSVIRRLEAEVGPMDEDVARRRIDIFRKGASPMWCEGTPETRLRWHNQKYFTWVEQQGKTVEELEALKSPAFWEGQQARIAAVDAAITNARR